MMKNKKWIAVVCVVLAAAFILGITGVISFPADASVKKPDRLIGVLVTLDQPDPFNGEAPVPEGYRFQAARVEKDHGPYEDDPDSRFVEVNYVFEGLKGMTLMNPELPLDGEASYGTTLRYHRAGRRPQRPSGRDRQLCPAGQGAGFLVQ